MGLGFRLLQQMQLDDLYCTYMTMQIARIFCIDLIVNSTKILFTL